MTAVQTVNGAGEVIDGQAVEVYSPPPPALFGTTDPAEVIVRAARIADALRDVIVERKLYQTIGGHAHVKVEGWQLLGSMLGVTAVCVCTEPVDGGWKATVEARTPDGRVVGRADALCTRDERRWREADDYARLSMSQTRATSKALKGPLGFVISMAGYATTPVEEMSRDTGPSQPTSQVTSQPVAAPAKPSERPATAKQRTLIEARSAHLTADELANVLKRAAGSQTVVWQDGAAQRWADRALDRLPARLVDEVLAQIQTAVVSQITAAGEGQS